MVSRETEPGLPRRLFLAAGLSAVTVSAAVALGVLGALEVPQTAQFAFSRGTNLASGEEARLRGFIAQALEDNRLEVVVTGHTSGQGDTEANLDLSAARAQMVADIAREMGLPGDRVTANGVGGGDPLARPDGMSDRAYQTLLSRVDVTLKVHR